MLEVVPKKVCFDIGNVLTHLNLDAFTNALMELGHIERREEGDLFMRGIQAGCDIGIFNVRESVLSYFKEISHDDLEKLNHVWLDSVTPCPEMGLLLANLKEQGFEIYLLSNIGWEHAEHVRKFYGFNLCKEHFSCEVGARKPSKLFFSSFINENPDYRGVKYFDDLKENVRTALKYGLDAEVFDINDFSCGEDAAEYLEQKILGC